MLALLLDTPASRARFTPDMQSSLVIQDVTYNAYFLFGCSRWGIVCEMQPEKLSSSSARA